MGDERAADRTNGNDICAWCHNNFALRISVDRTNGNDICAWCHNNFALRISVDYRVLKLFCAMFCA